MLFPSLVLWKSTWLVLKPESLHTFAIDHRSNEMKLTLKSEKPKGFMELKVHQGDVKHANSL